VTDLHSLERPSVLRKLGAGLMLVLVMAIMVLALPLFRSLLFQPFSSPSGSMMPTLLVGDHFFVSKFAYGYSRYSFPFSPPLFRGRIFGSTPGRGDVVVFRLPRDDSTDYIKRVVGLPGDKIQMIDGQLYINGTPVKRERVEDFVGAEEGPGIKHIKRWKETLPNGVSYYTLDLIDNSFYDNTPLYTVPPDCYFMLGDNRDNSTDSRVLSQVGYVPIDHIVGRATIIFFSLADGERARWDRTFQPVK
jgi:signal peptidase I